MATIDLGGLSADIARYTQRLVEEAQTARQKAAFVLQDRTRERAAQDEGWAHLADDIHVWSQDGMLVLGVNNQDLVSQAMLLEYGDETTSPVADAPNGRCRRADGRECCCRAHGPSLRVAWVSNDFDLDVYPLLAEPDLDTHRGFILAEEQSLKDHLSGITVPAVPAKTPPAARDQGAGVVPLPRG